MLVPLRVQGEGPNADELGFWAHFSHSAEPMMLPVLLVLPLAGHLPAPPAGLPVASPSPWASALLVVVA